MEEVPPYYDKTTISVTGPEEQDQEQQKAEQEFKMQIFRQLPDVIAGVIADVRKQHPEISDEATIQRLVKAAIEGVASRSMEITMNSRPKK